jgi:hypothetical protein
MNMDSKVKFLGLTRQDAQKNLGTSVPTWTTHYCTVKNFNHHTVLKICEGISSQIDELCSSHLTGELKG